MLISHYVHVETTYFIICSYCTVFNDHVTIRLALIFTLAIIDTHKQELMIVQIVFGTICLAKLIFALLGFYATVSDRNGTIALLSNIRMYLFGIFTVISVVEVIYTGVDPLAQWGIFSPLATSVLYALNYPLAIAAFVALLFHWYQNDQSSF